MCLRFGQPTILLEISVFVSVSHLKHIAKHGWTIMSPSLSFFPHFPLVLLYDLLVYLIGWQIVVTQSYSKAGNKLMSSGLCLPSTGIIEVYSQTWISFFKLTIITACQFIQTNFRIILSISMEQARILIAVE